MEQIMKQSREEKNRALNSAKTYYSEYVALKNEVICHMIIWS